MIETGKPKILIAEDERIVAMDIQMRLEKAGYLVVASVVSGEDAVQKAISTRPDLALMDISLQGKLDGIAAADEIHQQLDIPVVYLTSYSNQTMLERAKLSEAYAYLLKPFEERTLLSTLEVALYKHTLDREVRRREQQFRGIVERNFDAIISLDLEGNITYASPATERITGYKVGELNGKSFPALLAARDVSRVGHIRLKTLQEKIIEGIELQMMRKDGELIYIELNSLPIVIDGIVTGIQGIFRDITERKKSELELQYRATHDYLTDLPNMRLFLEHLEKAVERARRSHLYVALMYLDLDGFKTVNDAYGHRVGDHLLHSVARRLENSVRKVDIVSRLGGDEFTILMTDLRNLQNIEALAKRLHQALQTPIEMQNTVATITGSIGISIFPRDTEDIDTLIRYADEAMYSSKSLGKNRFSYFSGVENK